MSKRDRFLIWYYKHHKPVDYWYSVCSLFCLWLIIRMNHCFLQECLALAWYVCFSCFPSVASGYGLRLLAETDGLADPE